MKPIKPFLLLAALSLAPGLVQGEPLSPPTVSPSSFSPSTFSQARMEAALLPVRSPLLSPGEVIPRPLHLPGWKPLFLVGDDARSRAWLQERRSTLQTLGATGLVVKVDSLDALAELRRLAPGVSLYPVSGDDLARRLKISHYPALLTATGIAP